MTAAEKVTALTLLESGRAELAVPVVSGAMAMKQALVDAADVAGELKRIIEDNGLSKSFRQGQKPYVFSDGWLTASRIQNESTFSEVIKTYTDEATGEQIVHAKGWLEDVSGRIVARADGYVSTGEEQWSTKPFYARASMAQTRAVAKAMRIRHAWIMVMAGYSPTPAEEMEGMESEPPPPPPAPVPVKVTKANPQLPPGEKPLKVVKVPPEKSKIHPPQEAAPAPDKSMEVVMFTGFGEVDAKGRMGIRTTFNPGTEEENADWVNSWSSTDQALIKERVLAAKRAAKDAGQDPKLAGAKFVASLRRSKKDYGDGFWVDIESLTEVANEG